MEIEDLKNNECREDDGKIVCKIDGKIHIFDKRNEIKKEED